MYREGFGILVRKLAHASQVVQPGKTFMRRMFELLAGKQSAHHHICLSKAFRSDLQWWATFLWKVGHIDALWKFELESASTPCVDHHTIPYIVM